MGSPPLTSPPPGLSSSSIPSAIPPLVPKLNLNSTTPSIVPRLNLGATIPSTIPSEALSTLSTSSPSSQSTLATQLTMATSSSDDERTESPSDRFKRSVELFQKLSARGESETVPSSSPIRTSPKHPPVAIDPKAHRTYRSSSTSPKSSSSICILTPPPSSNPGEPSIVRGRKKTPRLLRQNSTVVWITQEDARASASEPSFSSSTSSPSSSPSMPSPLTPRYSTPRDGVKDPSPRHTNGLGNRIRSLSRLEVPETYKQGVRDSITQELAKDTLHELTVLSSRQVLTNWISKHPFSKEQDRNEDDYVKRIAKMLMICPPEEIYHKLCMRIASLAAMVGNFPVPTEQGHAHWVEDLHKKLIDFNSTCGKHMPPNPSSSSSPVLSSNGKRPPLKLLMKSLSKMSESSARVLIRQAIGHDTLDVLRKVIKGDHDLVRECFVKAGGSRTSADRFDFSEMNESELDAFARQLSTYVYEWPKTAGETAITVPNETRTYQELVRCIVVSTSTLFHRIAITGLSGETVELKNNYIYDKAHPNRIPQHVISFLIQALAHAGWPSSEPVDEAISKTLDLTWTPYFSPLYSFGNVVNFAYFIMREMLSNPDPKLALTGNSYDRPSAEHHLTLLSPTTFKTETTRVYELCDATRFPVSLHRLMTTTYWSSQPTEGPQEKNGGKLPDTLTLERAEIKFDGLFAHESHVDNRRQVLNKWWEGSTARRHLERGPSQEKSSSSSSSSSGSS